MTLRALPLLFAFTLLPQSAHADEKGDAVAAYNKGDFEGALKILRPMQKKHPMAETLFQIALCEEKAGKLEEALNDYDQVSKQPAADEGLIADAEAAATALRARLAEQEEAKPQSPPQAAPAPAQSSTPAAHPEPSEESHRGTWGWGLVISGGVLGLVGFPVAASHASKVDDMCPDHTCQRAADGDEFDRQRNLGRVFLGVGVVGVVAAGVGVYLLASDDGATTVGVRRDAIVLTRTF